MKENEIDVENIDLEKLREKTAENPGLLPYAHTVGGVAIKPEDKGKLKGRAVSSMHEQTHMQLDQIYQQMELLASQATKIKERMEVSERVYAAEIPFEPLPGKVYHLYQREEGQDVLSMIAPNEWGRSYPFSSFVATLKLLADHTWEIQEH